MPPGSAATGPPANPDIPLRRSGERLKPWRYKHFAPLERGTPNAVALQTFRSPGQIFFFSLVGSASLQSGFWEFLRGRMRKFPQEGRQKGHSSAAESLQADLGACYR